MLDRELKKRLRTRAHALRPVVQLGAAGASAAVLTEVDLQLTHHELIKVRARGSDRAERKAAFQDICRQTGAEIVQQIGHVAVLYRPNPEEPDDERASAPGPAQR